MRSLRRFLSMFLPLDDNDGNEEEPTGGTPPGSEETPPGETPAEGTPPEGGDEEREAIREAARKEAADLIAANARIKELEEAQEDEINRRAEERLHELLPELPEDVGQTPPARGARETEGGEGEGGYEELTAEERLDRLEMERSRDQARMDGDRLLAGLENLHKTKYQHMNMVQVLNILERAESAGRTVDIEKVCEMSHRQYLGEKEAYHQERLGDAEYMKSLVEKHNADPGTTSTDEGDDADPPPTVPTQRTSTGATPPGTKVKITRGNAASILAERLKQSGFGRKEVGAKPE